ncbi:MAG: CDP-glycerol glycerophosphotransferase family protein, partial [Proteobacteria bacterium]|nr:CDP-glycerol glycerophosphotransferase family protein [Pseudomonadota bacterium]
GKTIQMGYPRYDDYFNVPDIGEDLKKTFSCEPKKKTIVWLPTFGAGMCSIPYYAKQISDLSQDYNVIVRPHPINFRLAPENIKLLMDHNFKIDDDSLRDMNALYKIADFVICDYGGTTFSALYVGKNIILLNIPEADECPVSKGSSNLVLRKELSPVLNIKETENLKEIIQDESIWIKQADQRKIAFAKYFAPYQGSSAKRVVSILSDLMANDRATVS